MDTCSSNSGGSDKEPPQTDRCHLKYFINRQYGYNISRNFHSSLYAVERLHLSHQFIGENTAITSLTFNKKGNFLVNGSNDDGTITIWNWEKSQHIATLQFIYREVRCIVLFHQLKWLPLDIECVLISSDSNGAVSTLNINTGAVHKLFGDESSRYAIATHKDFPCVILCADNDSNVFSIDVRDNRKTQLLSVKNVDGNSATLHTIDAHPLNGYEFCVGGNMSCVNVYDRRMPSDCLSQLFPEHMGLNGFSYVDHVLYNHDGTEILASYGDEAIYLFDATRIERRRNCTHKYHGLIRCFNTSMISASLRVRDINFFGPNSECITALADDGQILIWEKKSEALVRLIQGEQIFGSLKPHPHFPILATGGSNIYIWTPSS